MNAVIALFFFPVALIAANFFLKRYWYLVDFCLVACTVLLTVNSGLGAGGALVFCLIITALGFLGSFVVELILILCKRIQGKDIQTTFLVFGGRCLLVWLASFAGVFLTAMIIR